MGVLLLCVNTDRKHWNLFNLPDMMYIEYLIVFHHVHKQSVLD